MKVDVEYLPGVMYFQTRTMIHKLTHIPSFIQSRLALSWSALVGPAGFPVTPVDGLIQHEALVPQM